MLLTAMPSLHVLEKDVLSGGGVLADNIILFHSFQ